MPSVPRDYLGAGQNYASKSTANPNPNATLKALCTKLNATEICYPGTTLRLVCRPIRSSIFPPGQDV